MTEKIAKKGLNDSAYSEEEEVKEKKMKTADEKLSQKVISKADKGPEKETDNEGNEYYSLGRDRRVSISTFKGKLSINIREYYKDKKTGEMKPGKRGITLNAIEWRNLLAVADQLHLAQEE